MMGAVRRRNPRRGIPFVGVAAAAVLAGALGCGPGAAPQDTPAGATATIVLTGQGESGCAELGGTIAADQTCNVRSATPAYTIDISLPLDYPEMGVVTDFVKRDRDDFLDWVDKFGPSDRRGRPYQYTVTAKTFRSGTPESGTQSLVLDIDNDTGFAHEGHPNTIFQAFNFDLGKRAAITFDTLFKPGTNPRAVLDPIVRRQLHAPTAELSEETYRNFALTNESVTFFFGQDQVVQDNAGPKRVIVPRNDLAGLLA